MQGFDGSVGAGCRACRHRQSELLLGTNDFNELIALKLPSGHALHVVCAGRSLYEPRAHKEHSVWAGLALKKLPTHNE